MAKKSENKPDLTEISTIRDILMGSQMNEYEGRFVEMASQLKDSEKRMMKKMEKMQEEFVSRLSSLEEVLQRNVSELDTKVDRKVDQDRIQLGKLLADLSNELLKKK